MGTPSYYKVQIWAFEKWNTIVTDNKSFCQGYYYHAKGESPRYKMRVIRADDEKVIEECEQSPKPNPQKQYWEVTDYFCKACDVPILKCVAGQGMTPGGNPVFKHLCCDRQYSDFKPDGERK